MLNTAKDWDFAKYDLGITAQTMLLGAVEKGLGGCILGAIDREKLRAHFSLDQDLEIGLVLALGKPAEDVRIVDLPADGSIRYYRDEAGVHYVPKEVKPTWCCSSEAPKKSRVSRLAGHAAFNALQTRS